MWEATPKRAIGRRLRSARLLVGFSVYEWAQEMGLPPDLYGAVEEGEAEPDIAILLFTSRVTGRSIDWIITGRHHQPDDARPRNPLLRFLNSRR